MKKKNQEPVPVFVPRVPTPEERADSLSHHAEWQAGILSDQIEALACRIREMADVVYNRRNFESASSAVAGIQHEILWGLANFGLDNMASNAAEIDSLRAEAKGIRSIIPAPVKTLEDPCPRP